MTKAILLKGLTLAKEERANARKQMRAALTKKQWREAEENLNFWQGKVSFYESQKE